MKIFSHQVGNDHKIEHKLLLNLTVLHERQQEEATE